MPERWEREIRRLGDLRPREDLAQRVAEGPRGEPSPPTRQRVVAAVTALTLFVATVVFVLFGPGSDRPDSPVGNDPVGDGTLVLELRSQDGAPAGTLRYGDLEQAGVVEGYQWCVGEDCTSMIADFAFFPPVNEYLVVPPGTPIEVTGEGSAEELRILDPDGTPIANGVGTIPDVEGQYVLGVGAVWAQGDETGNASMFFGVQALSSIEAAPDVLNVDCSAGEARADSAVVRTQSDGVHFVFTGTEGFTEFGIVHLSTGMGGRLDGDGPQVMPVPPGPWEVGCGTGERPVEPGELTASFEVVDPADHYAPIDVGCSDRVGRDFTSEISGDAPPQEAARQLLVGLGPGDRLRAAGYGLGETVGFPFVSFVVDRGGEAVARLTIEAGITWRGTFENCPGSGITVAEPESDPSGAPDVLVLRCEGLGPAVDADIVRLQPDGLHIEATNVADATVVALDPEDGTVEALVFPFESATETILADVPAGMLWVGCRVPDEQGEIAGGPDEVPDAYARITVLPSEA